MIRDICYKLSITVKVSKGPGNKANILFYHHGGNHESATVLEAVLISKVIIIKFMYRIS